MEIKSSIPLRKHLLIKDKEILVYLTDDDGSFYNNIARSIGAGDNYAPAFTYPYEMLNYIPL